MHRLLERQLRRHAKTGAAIPEEYAALFDAISVAYDQFDADRALLERSMEIASQELVERNQQLEKINAEVSSAGQQLRATLESTADGILVVDGLGHVMNWNGKFLQMWGMPTELLEQRDDEQLIQFALAQVKDPAVFTAKIEQLYKDKSESSLDVVELIDGRVFERYSQPQRLGNGRVWSFRDVTEKRSAAEALQKAKDDAEVANCTKSEFLANMSHEIRTPMTAILGFSELLLDPEQTEEERVEGAQTIRRNGEHLLKLINDILDISKIEAGKMTIERIACPLNQLIDDVTTTMRQRSTDKGIEFKLDKSADLPGSIVTDPTRLRQILINLLGNAIKFTDKGRVSLSAKMDGRLLRIDVSDTGIGMTPEHAKRLFQPFMQADASMSRRFGGTGLGLAISKSLAQMLGGDIAITSEMGKGSTFSLTIDAGETGIARPAAPVKKPGDSNLTGWRILLAEDGIDNQRLIKFHLERAGANVTVVNNGAQAWDAAIRDRDRGLPFDVILMDMQMPQLDGFEATALLRTRGYTRPIVALTAHVMDEDKKRCFATGCDGFVGKPIDRVELIETVKNVTASLARDPQIQQAQRLSA